MIIHFHFHFKTTGVTRSVESIVPCLNKFEETKVFGYGISSDRISFIKVLKAVFLKDKTIKENGGILELMLTMDFLIKEQGLQSSLVENGITYLDQEYIFRVV